MGPQEYGLCFVDSSFGGVQCKLVTVGMGFDQQSHALVLLGLPSDLKHIRVRT